MVRRSCLGRFVPLSSIARLAITSILLLPAVTPSAAAQDTQTGSIGGRVVDDEGAAVANAQVYIDRPAVSGQTRADGNYVINRVPVGTYTLRVRLLGFRPGSASVTVSANQRTTQDFTLTRDPLQLQTMVVTGTQTPRMNLDASVAVTTLTAREVEQAAPRSTTEMLRYVPGFTRVESSGGEVNQNISIRGILGVEYVMFMEDGMPVFPTMHTFFMNADNLFRFDENIDRMEVVRGGASALFGSNTPGAIINYINKTGGDHFAGTMRATAATQALARYDLNAGGPLGENWRFNVGGFYRYDHGVRDPGYPGIRGGQLKANVTRLLNNGYIRATVKHIDDRNQFILPLPLTDPANPEYVPGFGNYGAFNTNEGLDLRVPTPSGDLTLPLDNGLKTQATWFTVDASLDMGRDWHIQNTAQAMQNNQEHNAIVPGSALPAADFVAGLQNPDKSPRAPAGSTVQYFFTNHFDLAGNRLPFDTPNGLVAPAIEWHVNKPISAIQDQLQLRKTIGRHAVALGAYFANYTQDNHWNFTDILMDVRDNPRFLDLVVTPPAGTPDSVTKNGFRNFLSTYANGTGQTSIVSGTLGAEVQLTERLRADIGGRVEYDNYVQSSERTSTIDLDNNPATTYNNEQFGNGSFRHFTKNITDWAASVGLNFRMTDQFSLYASGSRGYKMPALDDFLNANAQEQVDLFDSRDVRSIEGGVKTDLGRAAVTVNGFYTDLKNVVGQGLEVVNGVTTWVIRNQPTNRSYGAEVEAVLSPVPGLQIQGNVTVLKAELGGGVDSLAQFVGRRLQVVPTNLGNLSAIFSPAAVVGLQLRADWHWVGSRFSEDPLTRPAVNPAILPFYNYFNFGVGFDIPNAGARINLDLLNAFQDKGLEEGNPRLSAAGSTSIFLARPLLPRRLQASISYDFGGGQGPQAQQQ
jgi:iron complex outermembrane recepter protein